MKLTGKLYEFCCTILIEGYMNHFQQNSLHCYSVEIIIMSNIWFFFLRYCLKISFFFLKWKLFTIMTCLFFFRYCLNISFFFFFSSGKNFYYFNKIQIQPPKKQKAAKFHRISETVGKRVSRPCFWNIPFDILRSFTPTLTLKVIKISLIFSNQRRIFIDFHDNFE